MKKLKHFTIDENRHLLVSLIKLYKMDMKTIVEKAMKNDPKLFDDGTDTLPSWAKFAADPNRARGFFVQILQALFLGKGNADEVNAAYQFKLKGTEHRVMMMFVPGGTKNENLLIIESIARDALRGFDVKAIGGATGMKNATAEREVMELVASAKKNNRNVLLLSAGMASRSFSIKEITELYLAYDNGDNGATIQKMSRALTSWTEEKVGRIISLSFDPNRDDKFDTVLLETAANYTKTHNLTSPKDALREVFRTVDIFDCLPNGALKIEEDTYLNRVIESGSLTRVIGRAADLTKLTEDEMQYIATNGKKGVAMNPGQAAALKGKTRATKARTKKNGKPIPKSLIADVREVITTIVENLDIIILGTNSTNLHDAFNAIRANASHKDWVEDEFGLRFSTIETLFASGVFNENLLKMRYDL